jgi:proteasome-associated ATPase
MNESGSSGRRGFVRDVMKRLSTQGARGPEDPEESMQSDRDDLEGLREALRFLGPDSADVGRRIDRLLTEFELVRQRYDRARRQLYDAERQNEKLVNTLQDAKQQMELLKEEVDKLCSPPNTFGVYERANKDGTIEINVDGKLMRVNVHPSIRIEDLMEGQLVVLNEAFNVIDACGFETRGEITQVADVLDDGRVMVLGHADEERVISLSQPMRRTKLKVGDNLLINSRTGYGVEKMPKSTVDEVVLEEVPDVTYDDIGGLGDQIEVLHDSIELPYMYADEFRRYQLDPPKGILLYGPPGCGKTMIGKAIANSLAQRMAEVRGVEAKSYFLNVKGPELLNKYVGETEHKLREVFKNAREKAAEDVPVVIFFDEMDSLSNVIVVGASNRQDLIDPAVLRPGRLDLKIKVQRPDRSGAREIFLKYLKSSLPLHESAVRRYGPDPESVTKGIVDEVIEGMYAESEENKFLEVTYAKGEREIFYFKDFSSGAMIKNIVDRAKKKAVKRLIDKGEAEAGIDTSDLAEGVREEFKADDWARISGRKGERIINVRTLISGISRQARTIETVGGAGQYL